MGKTIPEVFHAQHNPVMTKNFMSKCSLGYIWCLSPNPQHCLSDNHITNDSDHAASSLPSSKCCQWAKIPAAFGPPLGPASHCTPRESDKLLGLHGPKLNLVPCGWMLFPCILLLAFNTAIPQTRPHSDCSEIFFQSLDITFCSNQP